MLLATAAGLVVLLFVLYVSGAPSRWEDGVWYVTAPVDLRVLAYAAGVALFAMTVCSLAPALQVTRPGLMDAMKRQSAQSTPLRGVLLGVQVAISVTVLLCAALLVRGAHRAANVDVGFQSRGISIVSVQMHWKDFFERGTGNLVERLREHLRPLGPVGVAATGPMSALDRATVRLPARAGGDEERATVAQALVDGGYFNVLGIRVVAGRNLVPRDRDRDVVLVNETMARRYWPGENPLGRIIGMPVERTGPFPLRDASTGERDHQVVGVVGDAHLTELAVLTPTLFRVHRESDQTFTLLVPQPVASTAAAIVRQLDGGASVRVEDVSTRIEAEILGARYLARIATSLGVLALLLATTGVYGVVAYAVEGRRREIGIRMALGAPARTVIRAVISCNAPPCSQSWLSASPCRCLPRACSWGGCTASAAWIHPTYAGVLLIVLAAGVVASALPALRAARIDPVKVLHAD